MAFPPHKLLPGLVGAGCGLALALGTASPAEAIRYDFNNSSVSWIQGSGTNAYDGNGSIQGNFDYSGGTTLGSLNVTFNATTNTIGAVSTLNFGSGAFGFVLGTGATTSLLFSSTNDPANCVNSTSRNCLQIQLGNSLSTTQNSLVSIDTAGNVYNNTANSGNNSNKLITLTGPSSGNVTSVPSPVSGLLLCPLASALCIRHRYRKLVSASLPSTAA